MTPTSISDPVAGTVWATGQHSPAVQRRDRYVPESIAHPAKMLPAIAAHAIATYTRPGDLVLDPMCGIGTTLVEALHPDRRAVGVEYEPRWAEPRPRQPRPRRPARRGQPGEVFTGDARHLDWRPAPRTAGPGRRWWSPPRRTGPPPTARSPPTTPAVHKRHHRYGDLLDRGNLANIGHHRLLAGFTRILTVTAPYLRPGGHVVITVRPWREHAELIDLPTQILACAAPPDWSRSNAASPCSAGSPTPAGSSPAARSSNATSSANNAPAGYRCT